MFQLRKNVLIDYSEIATELINAPLRGRCVNEKKYTCFISFYLLIILFSLSSNGNIKVF